MSKTCINCGVALHDDANFCHICEHSQIEKTKVEMPRYPSRIICIAAWILLLAAAALLLVPRLNTVPKKQQAVIEYISDHEAVFANEEISLRLGVSFGDEPLFLTGNSYYTTTIGSQESYYKWTHLYALNSTDATAAQAEFLNLFERAYVESIDPESGQLHSTFEVDICKDDEPLEALQCAVHFDSKTGKRDLVWHIFLTTGDELIFRQNMEIKEKAALIFTADDWEMNTIEDLRTLIQHIETTTTIDDEVVLYLPAVTYEGGLTLGRGYTIYGSQGTNGSTTFTDTVVSSAPEPQIVQLVNITFEGSGSGTGLIDHCGTSLIECTLRNWEVAAKTEKSGWILSFGSTYQNNQTAIEFNCFRTWYNASEYPDNRFIDNKNALVLYQIFPISTFTFENSLFRGNENLIVNYTQQSVDLSGAILE